jgi:hypothetical protein
VAARLDECCHLESGRVNVDVFWELYHPRNDQNPRFVESRHDAGRNPHALTADPALTGEASAIATMSGYRRAYRARHCGTLRWRLPSWEVHNGPVAPPTGTIEQKKRGPPSGGHG